MLIRTTAVAALISIAGSAAAQTWTNPLGGNWNNIANWSGGDVPNIAPETATLPNLGMPYSVNLDTNIGISELTLESADQTLSINSNRSLAIDASTFGISNNGLIRVNDTASVFNTELRILGTNPNMQISGTGSILLNGGGDVFDAQLIADGGLATIVNLNQPVTGAGRIDSNCDFRNNSIIQADVATFDIRIEGDVDQTGGGMLEGINGGFISLNGASIVGGQILGGVEVGDDSTITSSVLTGNNAVRSNQIANFGFPGVTNNGTFVVDPTGSVFASRIRGVANPSTGVAGTVEIDGTGTIVLNATTNDTIDSAIETIAQSPIRIGSGQLVQGAGSIRGVVEPVFLDGDVLADVLDLPLEIRGTLQGSGTSSIQGTTGVVVIASAATVEDVIFNGGIETQSSNTIRDVSSTGTFGLRGFATTSLGGTLNNTGELTINTTFSSGNARLDINEPATITGDGEIILNGGADLLDAEIKVNAGQTLDVGSQQTISGAGQFTSNGMTTFQGTMNADRTDTDLRLLGNFDLTGAQLLGSLGFINIRNADTIGGTFLNRVETSGVSSMADFTTSGLGGVRDFGALIVRGTVNNGGTFTVNIAGGSGNASLQCDSPGTVFTGPGQWVLNAGAGDLFDAQLEISPGANLTVSSSSSVSGSGDVNATNGPIFMQGSFIGTTPGQDLRIRGMIDMTGGSAQNGGGFTVFDDADVINGTLFGFIESRGVGSFENTIVDGELGLRDNATTRINTSITNNGTITINAPAGNANASLLAGNNCTIDGTGTIVLNINSDIFDAVLEGDNGESFSMEIGSGQTITGTGTIRGPLLLSGTVSVGAADDAPNRIRLERELTWGAGSVTELDIAGNDFVDFDHFFGGSTIELDGELVLRLQNGFVPAFGDRFEILDAANDGISGSFSSVDTPQIGNLLFRLDHQSDQVEAVWTCPADVNVDGSVGPADFTAWLSLFNNASDPNRMNADVNLDGSVTPADFTAWLGAFNAGCP